MLALTAVASTGVPSENLTPARRWIVSDRPPGWKSQLVARPGSSWPEGLSWVRVSKIRPWSILSHEFRLAAGSKVLGVNTLGKSTPKRSTPLGSGVPPALTRVIPAPAMVVLVVVEAPPAVVGACDDELLPPLHAAASVTGIMAIVIRRSRALMTSPPGCRTTRNPGEHNRTCPHPDYPSAPRRAPRAATHGGVSNTTQGWPAGWYADPWFAGQQRWWDGAAWTPHVQAPTPVVTAPSAAPMRRDPADRAPSAGADPFTPAAADPSDRLGCAARRRVTPPGAQPADPYTPPRPADPCTSAVGERGRRRRVARVRPGAGHPLVTPSTRRRWWVAVLAACVVVAAVAAGITVATGSGRRHRVVSGPSPSPAARPPPRRRSHRPSPTIPTRRTSAASTSPRPTCPRATASASSRAATR